MLEYSRRFHIYDSGTTRNVWIGIGFVWKVFGSMEVEAMTCKDEWLLSDAFWLSVEADRE